MLRRGQMSVLASPEFLAQDTVSFDPVVDVGPYHGVLGTVYSIVWGEGERGNAGEPSGGKAAKKKNKKVEKKGQGFEGLWRGWRIGMWGLVGVWGIGTMGAGNNVGEF